MEVQELMTLIFMSSKLSPVLSEKNIANAATKYNESFYSSTVVTSILELQV